MRNVNIFATHTYCHAPKMKPLHKLLRCHRTPCSSHLSTLSPGAFRTFVICKCLRLLCSVGSWCCCLLTTVSQRNCCCCCFCTLLYCIINKQAAQLPSSRCSLKQPLLQYQFNFFSFNLFRRWANEQPSQLLWAELHLCIYH